MTDDSIARIMKQETRTQMCYSIFTDTLTIRIDPELKSEFKKWTKLRGVSECHVADALFRAWIEGQKAEATVIKPVVVNLHMDHIVARPRRAVDLWEPKRLMWPPNCEYAKKFFVEDRSVGCVRRRDVIDLRECYKCFRENNSS